MMALMGIFHLDGWGQEQVDSSTLARARSTLTSSTRCSSKRTRLAITIKLKRTIPEHGGRSLLGHSARWSIVPMKALLGSIVQMKALYDTNRE